MSRKFPSLQAVAEAAGVSKSTASLALRNDLRVSPATLLKVRESAKRLGFKSNAIVAELMAKLRESRTPAFQAPLALVNCSSDSDFLARFKTYRRWLDGANRRADELGYKIDYFWGKDPKTRPDRLRSIFLARNVRGVILAQELGQKRLPSSLRFLWENYPNAALGCVTEPNLHVASNDQYSTSLNAVRELFNRGYRRFGLMSFSDQDINVDHRFCSGFLAACRELGPKIEVHSILNITPPSRIEQAFHSWAKTNKLDAILAFHRDTSRWLLESDKKLSKGVAVVHLDWDSTLAPEAGTDQNSETIGSAAVDLVISQLHAGERGIPAIPKVVFVQSTWMEGTTVRKAPQVHEVCRNAF